MRAPPHRILLPIACTALVGTVVLPDALAQAPKSTTVQAGHAPAVPKLKPGGKMAALFNRSALRAYAVKIEERRISTSELADYIAKGGSYQRIETYDTWRNFNVGQSDGAVLTRFIDGPGLTKPQLQPDRLQSLQLLLNVGADPNRQSETEALGGLDTLSPTLFAAAGNDLEALRLLVAHGGDITRREKHYLGWYGPALALASRPDVLDYLLQQGADPGYADPAGKNLLILAVESTSSLPQQEKIRWLIAHGASPTQADRAGKTAEQYARERLLLARQREREMRTGYEQARRDAQEQGDPQAAANADAFYEQGLAQYMRIQSAMKAMIDILTGAMRAGPARPGS